MNLIFLFLYTGVWVSTLISYFFPIIDILHIVFFELILILLIYTSIKNKLAFIMSISTFIYFYQAPLLKYLPHVKLGVYEYALNKDIEFEASSVYDIVLGCLIILILYLQKFNFFEIMITKIKKNIISKYMYKISLIFSILLILYAFYHSGGIDKYLLLNKFQASEAQKFLLFTYKDFAMIAIFLGLILYKDKINIIFIIYIISIIILEILSAKRFMVMYIFIAILIISVNKIKPKYILGIVFGIFFMTLLKFIYYNIRDYILGIGSFSDIFWFKWSDVFKDIIFIHEGRAHIELLLNYLYHDITFEPTYFIKQLLISFPFGYHYVDHYLSAGEYLRLYLHEPWTGLASSQYIVPYLSIGFLGIIFIYFLIAFILYFFKTIIIKTNSIYFSILFLVNTPILLFYEHREEIVLIIKNLIISSFVLFFVLFISRLTRSFLKNFIRSQNVKKIV